MIPLPASRQITQVRYAPPDGYGLDLEIFQMSALRKRANTKILQATNRIEFYLLICVTQGRCTHMADFEPVACKPGSLLILQPGQVHRFDAKTDWQAWVLLYRPEFRQPQKNTMSPGEAEVFQHLEDLPVHLVMNTSEQQVVMASIARMFEDTRIKASRSTLHALLRNQLYTLLIRLHLIQSDKREPERAAALAAQRFKRYRSAVEQEFHRWHRVSDYAKFLGCSEKTIGRATLEIAGTNAKTYLSQRIALEAKRLLAHTGSPVSVIADTLGFDEATNFVKCFRRQLESTPREFRAQQTTRYAFSLPMAILNARDLSVGFRAANKFSRRSAIGRLALKVLENQRINCIVFLPAGKVRSPGQNLKQA